MSLQTELEKRSSTRQSLVRFEIGKKATWTLVSGTIYSTPYAKEYGILPKITSTAGTLTEHTSYPPTADKYFQDQANDLLYINVAYNPNTETVVIFRHLTFTDGAPIYVNSDPLDTSKPVVLYESRLTTGINISAVGAVTINDNLSLSSSAITLADTGLEFKSMVLDGWSFSNKQILIWTRVNNEYAKVFEGITGGLIITLTTVSIEVVDSLVKLKGSAFMGDRSNECILKGTASSYPNIYYENIGSPVRYIFNKSFHSFEDNKAFSTSTGGIAPQSFQAYSISPDSLEIFNSNYSGSSNFAKTNNREWIVARTSTDGFKTLSFGTISNATVYGSVPPPSYFYLGTNCAYLEVTATGFNIEMGDNFRLVKSATNYYAIVTYVTTTKYYAMILNFPPPGSNQNWLTGVTYHSNQGPALMIDQGDIKILPVYTRDYTVSITTTSSGNKLMKINFVNGFEANHPGMTGLDPAAHKIYTRVSEATNSAYISHGKALQSIITKAGLAVDSATFTSADIQLDTDVLFTIPGKGDATYQSYLESAQRITRSTLGMLGLNNDYNICYYLLNTPGSGDSRSYFEILQGTYRFDVGYRDIITSIDAKNSNIDKLSGVGGSVLSVENEAAIAVHEIDNALQFDHVLTDISGRLQDILNVVSYPDIRETFETASLDLDTIINDDLTLFGDNVTVFGVSKSPNQTTITTTKCGSL